MNELWGGETTKAVENFQVSGEPIPRHVARWLGRIKAAAARVNAELGLLDADKAERIAAAGDRIVSALSWMNTGIALGVVFVMVYKHALAFSLVAMAIGAGAGIVVSLIGALRSHR